MSTIHSGFLLTPTRMKLNARFNLKCDFQMTHLTYVCCGFQSWPCMTEWTWALSVGTKMWPMQCSFWAKDVCVNFWRDLLHRRWQTGVEPLKLLIFHLMHRQFSDILRRVAFLAYNGIYAIVHYMPHPSVRLFVTWVDQSKTVEVRIMQTSPQSSPMTLVCWRLTSLRNSKGNIGSGGAE